MLKPLTQRFTFRNHPVKVWFFVDRHGKITSYTTTQGVPLEYAKEWLIVTRQINAYIQAYNAGQVANAI